MNTDLLLQKRMEITKDRMLQILKDIHNQFKRGQIQSPAELQHKVYKELQNFYDHIGQSTLEVIEAWGPPYSEDHNLMMEQILNDFVMLYGEIGSLTDDVKAGFDQVEAERQSYDKQIQEVESQINNLISGSKEVNDILVFREDFTTVDKFDKDAVEGTIANIMTDGGILTLGHMMSEEYNEYAYVRLVKGNGFPGNSRIIRATGQGLKYDGEGNLHLNLSHILDKNADTWFEYENFQLTREADDKTKRMNFTYKEGMKWAQDEYIKMDPLQLVVEVSFPKARKLNWFTIDPYIPPERGSIGARIERITVSDGKGTNQSITYNELMEKKKGYLFETQMVSSITMYLRQDTYYMTNIGHVFYLDSNHDILKALETLGDWAGARVHGKEVPSVENLGVRYNSSRGTIEYPGLKYGEEIQNDAERKRALYTIPKVDGSRLVGLESVTAKRWMIGLRDISMSCYQFADVSQYISKPFYSDAPIEEIQLDANYSFPEFFGDKTEYVEFWISIDDGQYWHRIHRKNEHIKDTKIKYMINADVPEEARLPDVGYLESLHDVYEVRVKIMLTRSNNAYDYNFYSPMVHDYELYAKVTEGAI